MFGVFFSWKNLPGFLTVLINLIFSSWILARGIFHFNPHPSLGYYLPFFVCIFMSEKLTCGKPGAGTASLVLSSVQEEVHVADRDGNAKI